MIKNVVSIRLPVAEKAVIRKNRILPAGLSEKEAESLKLPRICVVTGTHGDELEGQYVCFRLNRILAENPQFVSGIVDIYPAVNPLGIDSITRGIPRFDLDMNRIFPGDAKGTTEEVIAAKIISDMNGAACAKYLSSRDPSGSCQYQHGGKIVAFGQRTQLRFHLGSCGSNRFGKYACLVAQQDRSAVSGD